VTVPPGDLRFDAAAAPGPDGDAEPAGFVAVVEPNDRIHFLDWGGPTPPGEGLPDVPTPEAPAILLLHGLSNTAWSWTPVARRLRRARRTVAVDLRGHGLSDAPTSGYDAYSLAEDAIAVAEGAGLLAAPIVLAGHGYGGIVAAWTAARLGGRCAGLVLVDGGWEDLRRSTGLEPAEFLRAVDEPPEVLRSMAAFLADREAFDPSTWDADQERAARASVVELPAGRVVPSSRQHAIAGSVGAMFDYRPVDTLSHIRAPVVALMAAEDEAGGRADELDAVRAAVLGAGGPAIRVGRFPSDGHNLPRYRPAEVTAAILGVASGTTAWPRPEKRG
jgi:pimeloyl-ACP methyl ester carboxylesterase